MGKTKHCRINIDRGWAWVVMTSTYVGMVIYCVPLYMSGVIYMALLDKFHEGETKTSLIGAISTGLLCFAAPLGGAINNKYSCRVSIILGGALTTLGFALSAFVSTLDWIILTAGVLVGIGYGISSSGLICVVGFYFEKWRDTVISCAFFCVGLAMFVTAPFGIHLVTTYGLNSTFLILACIQAQMCVCGMLSKPSCIELEVLAQKEIERKRSMESRSKTYLDVTVMKNVSYTCFLCSISAWNFALCVAVMHLPNYMSLLGGSNSDIGLLMTSFSIANWIGRLLGSLTISKFHEKSVYVYTSVIGLNGLVTSLFILYADLYGGSYVFAAQLGLFTGWPNSMMTPISLSFVGVHKLSEAYGLAYVFSGIGVTSGPVLIGYLYAATRSYAISFLVAGGVLCLGCVCAMCSICCKSKSAPEEETMEVTVQEKDLLPTYQTTDLMFKNTDHFNNQITANKDIIIETRGGLNDITVPFRENNEHVDEEERKPNDNDFEITDSLLCNGEKRT